jgi:MFS family permease
MTTQATLSPLESNASLETNKKTPILLKILVMVSIMSLIGGTLTAVMTYMNVGLGDTFIQQWLSSFALAATVMMPVGMGMMALMTKVVSTLLPEKSEHVRNLVTGLVMAVFMESLMAFITAANTVGFSDASDFTVGWFNGFIAALPIGLAIMVVMSMTIKPKIEKFLKS